MEFRLHAPYEPTGDQPQAIDALVQGLDLGLSEQVLLGVTGSGKTFTMANVIARVNRPTLVLAHNKTLAAQLCSEFREFFPENAVEYFISYYDYYQPEAYIAHTDTYIEKDSSVNEEIDRLRHSATSALFERRDVIVVASVSCIYGLGDPIDYQNMVISLRIGQSRPMDEILRKLTEIRYERNDINFTRNTFRVRGDTLEIYPAYWAGRAIRVEFFGDEVDRISEINAVTGLPERILDHVAIYPASHYVTTREKMERAIREIEREMDERVKYFEERGKLLEAQRIAQRTRYDIEMMQEIGFCTGIENYSRVISGRAPGTPPMTLIDYFPDDFLLMVDESHVTLPQVRAMYNGDRSRKESLVQYGFRLPSAFDNRPLTFDEFESKLGQRIYISATPAPFERERAGQIAEQVIRPTGLLDPEVIVRPIDGQIDDLITEIHGVISRGERVLVTTLTKKMAEDLTDYLGKAGIRVRYMHSDVGAMERMEIIRDLRLAKFDVLVGINLLREGLDLPEVALVAILDADKEGFLRSETSLIQTIGRAARNAGGRVIMYADHETGAMRAAIDETNRRRAIQSAYNEAHGIVPKTIVKDVRELIEISRDAAQVMREGGVKMTKREREEAIARLEKQMRKAARMMEFEYAAALRDQIIELRGAR
ncbi:MAG: excinuclease ABC subunit UvrB [Ruminococcaceae bacterium]|jgi:excinuclease ABC, B subunit|nr:excinuclease ABC subunit UvrB [Oscillospiraceae bacterium]